MRASVKRLHMAAFCQILLLIFCVMPVLGHPLGGVFQETTVLPMGPFFIVEYKTHIGRDVLLTLAPDTDQDARLSEEEQQSLLARLAKILVPNLKAVIDGTDCPLMEMERTVHLEVADDYREGVNAQFIFRVLLPSQASSCTRFRFSDHNFLAGELDRLNYFQGIMGTSWGTLLINEGRDLEIRFIPGKVSVQENGGDALYQQSEHDKNAHESDMLSAYFARNYSGPWTLLVALLGAFLLGAAHALSPGHGKTMVAAYLVGTKGQVAHAVILGLVVTLTHVSMVVLLGISTLILSDSFLPQDLFPWLGAFSGLLIFVIGYWMLASRASSGLHHVHSHEHGHEYGHELGHELGHEYPHDHAAQEHGDALTLGRLFSLGIAGGIVPCPSALVVLLLSLSFQRVAEGLLLIVFFSLGLAAVLIAIGILTVTASKFMTKRLEMNSRWVQRLPLISSFCVMIAGIVIAFNAFVSAGIIRIVG